MIRSSALILALATPAVASDFTLQTPLRCDLRGECYIQQFVDHDPGGAAQDFTCSTLSYDGHKGTDFALRSHVQMEAGVEVVAAAAGVVQGVRNKMPDTGYTSDTAQAIKGKECGNGVVIQHPDGWETQYCHLRQGSIPLRRGDRVQAGDFLGLVGLSGRTQFPHLHLSVRRDGQVIDPFDPDGKIQCGAPDTNHLWTTDIAYRPGGLLDLGFADAVPEFSEVKAGRADRALSQSSPALVVFAYAFGVKKGDTIRMRFSGPNGELVSKDMKMTRNQAQNFRAIGKKRRKDWPVGRYTGSAALIRDGRVIDRIEGQFTLP